MRLAGASRSVTAGTDQIPANTMCCRTGRRRQKTLTVPVHRPDLIEIRYSVSSPPSTHTSHWSNSKAPCSLQKYRRQRLHVMKVILTRSSASHRSHWPALRALGIAISPRQVVCVLGTSFPSCGDYCRKWPASATRVVVLLITHRSSSLQLKTAMRWSCESQSQRHCHEPSPILLPADEEFTRMKVVLKFLALVQTGEPAGTQTHGPRLTSMNGGGSAPTAVAPSPSDCFCFDTGKFDCYFMRPLTTSIHSNDR
jgi:hypothetical protein